MLHTLLTLTTMTTVVLHALLGCCVHHVHAGQSGRGCCVETVAVEVQSGRCHGHSHPHHHHGAQADGLHACESDPESNPAPQSSDRESPQRQQSCSERDCTIVAEQRGNDWELMAVPVWSSLLTDSFRHCAPLFSTRTQIGPAPDPHGAGLPLRIENQVWRL